MITADVTAAAEGAFVVGSRRVVTLGGFDFNVDTIVATIAAGVVVIGLGLIARRSLSSGRPSRVRLAWETVISATERHLGSRRGAHSRQVVPLAVALFGFILTASLLELVPSGHPIKMLPAPTGDLNLTAALGLLIVAAVHVASIRSRGWHGYLRHYLHPVPWLLPLRVLEELVKPLTLALRLFGNIFAGTVMVVLIFELIPPMIAPVPLLAWKLFSVFVAGMQAFIFALLTLLYFDAALGADHDPGAVAPAPSPTTGGSPT